MPIYNIDWEDGTSDKITINYSGEAGNSLMTITSDPNMLDQERTKSVSIKDESGELFVVLTVKQEAHMGEELI